jgi:hypothetical protein
VRGALLVVMLAACEPAESKPPEPATEKPTPQRKPAKLKVEWANVQTTDGCFFFSGPEGRDDRLVGHATVERAGSAITITIAKGEFRGVAKDGNVTVTRQSKHDFSGPWLVNEVITGKIVEGGAIVARYHYDECELSAAECPGRCIIDADLTLR